MARRIPARPQPSMNRSWEIPEDARRRTPLVNRLDLLHRHRIGLVPNCGPGRARTSNYRGVMSRRNLAAGVLAGMAAACLGALPAAASAAPTSKAPSLGAGIRELPPGKQY